MVNECGADDGKRIGKGKRTTWGKPRPSATLITVNSTWHDLRSKELSSASFHLIRRYTDSTAGRTSLNNLILINEEPN
jgi:hypothetical protein